MRTLTKKDLQIRAELEATIAELQAQIEAQLAALLPTIGPQTAVILAMRLDVDPDKVLLQEAAARVSN